MSQTDLTTATLGDTVHMVPQSAPRYLTPIPYMWMPPMQRGALSPRDGVLSQGPNEPDPHHPDGHEPGAGGRQRRGDHSSASHEQEEERADEAHAQERRPIHDQLLRWTPPPEGYGVAIPIVDRALLSNCYCTYLYSSPCPISGEGVCVARVLCGSTGNANLNR